MGNLDMGHDTEPPTMNAQATAAAAPAQLFRGLAELVYATDDYTEVYSALCKAASTLVSGCDHASLMLQEGGKHFKTAAASDEIAATIDQFEREIGEGPCLDAIKTEGGFVEASLEEGSRWPKLAARVLEETPVRGVAGFRLLVDDQKVGALNIFSDTPGALTHRSVDEASVVTAFLSVALLGAHRRQAASSLRHGLESNREIGKAVGLMMAFHQVDDDTAFGLLRKASQDMNVKLAEVAREFVAHHNSRPQ